MTVLFNKPCIIFHYMTLSEDLSVCAHVLLVLYSSPSPRMYVWVHAKPKRKAKQEHTDMGFIWSLVLRQMKYLKYIPNTVKVDCRFCVHVVPKFIDEAKLQISFDTQISIKST